MTGGAEGFFICLRQCFSKISIVELNLSGYSKEGLKSLKHVLHIEKARLKSWGDAVGLDRESLIVAHLNHGLLALRELEVISQPQRSEGAPGSPTWGATQEESAKLLIQQLVAVNDELFNSLPSVQSQQIMAELRLVRLSRLVEISDLKQLLDFQVMESSSESDPQMQDFVKLKRQRLKVSEIKGPLNISHSPQGSEEVWAPQLRRQLLVKKEQPPGAAFQAGRREMATYETKPVLVEWKPYDPETITSRESTQVFKRVQRLAAMLHTKEHSSVRALHCLGYFEDEYDSRYCLIHSTPTGCHPRRPPMSLLDFIESKWRPSLTDRIALAQDLANCLLRLHAVGWLHKGLRSDNVIFFQKDDGSPRSLLDFRLVGFEFARKQGLDEFSEKSFPDLAIDIYQHPDYFRPNARFSKVFEYYSLGIVLIEIAIWQPIHKVLQKDIPLHKGRVKRSDIQKVRDILLDEQNEGRFATEIEFMMGSRYKNATYTCLSGDLGIDSAEALDEDSGESARKVLEAYARRVVVELANLRG